MRLILWEKDISKIQSRHTCHLKRAIIKDFNNTNYLTLNKQTEINYYYYYLKLLKNGSPSAMS